MYFVCIIHVFGMYFTCKLYVYVFVMYFTCNSNVFSMYFTCILTVYLNQYVFRLFKRIPHGIFHVSTSNTYIW